MEEVLYFNSQEAARILGVNVSTIKRWTDEGKLTCVKSAGGHRKFLVKDLSEFLSKHRKKLSKANLFPVESKTDLLISHHIFKGDFDYLISFVLRHAFSCNRERVLQVLQGLYMAQYPLHSIYDRLLVPVLHQIGTRWEAGEISVTEEHLASQSIRDGLIRLQGLIRIPTAKIGTALCLNFAEELHDIALKMVDQILELRGYRVLFSGQMTPVVDVAEIMSQFKPQRVYVSSSYIEDVSAVQAQFDAICEMCETEGAGLYIGGSGFSVLEIRYPEVVRAHLQSFAEVHDT